MPKARLRGARPRVSREFAIMANAGPVAQTAIIRSSEDLFLDQTVLGSLRIEFGGKSPLVSSRDPQVTEDGSLANVTLVPVLWDLVAACSRLLRGRSVRETVPLVPTSYALDIEIRAGRTAVRLTRSQADSPRLVAAANPSLREFVQECVHIAYLVSTSITDTNPDLKGNLYVQRFIAAIDRLRGELDR